MTLEIVVVLLVLAGAVVLFATERLPVDLVGLLVLVILLVSGIVTPAEGLAGFSNTATVTVAAMFIISAGLFATGAVNSAGVLLTRLGRQSVWLALVAIMLVVGAISAFINNTAAVAIFLPIVIVVARDLNTSASKLLMPLSFASMFGGVCTLIGTSTNILVSSVAERHGQAPFGMFEMAPLGIVFFGVGLVYMLTVGYRLIPDRRTGRDLTESYHLADYITDVVLLADSSSAGRQLAESTLVKELPIAVIGVRRGSTWLPLPGPETVLEAGDVLRVRTNVEVIRALQARVGVELQPSMGWSEEDLESEHVVLVEAVVAPNSALPGKTLEELRFRDAFGATVLAIRHKGELLREHIGTTPLAAGDALLVELRRDRLADLKQNHAFVLVSEVSLPRYRRSKVLPALLIVAFVVLTAALDLLPIVVSSVAGSVLLVLTGCITLDEAYEAIEWRIIFLLAGVLTLGVALEKTGAAVLLSDFMIASIGAWGPAALLSGIFLLTTLLTNVMSNNASAALLAPIAIATAESLGVSARPFLMAVTFAASLSFMTPIGYQTNTLIYGPGQYKFADFLRVGTPLNVIYWLLAAVLLPIFWPL